MKKALWIVVWIACLFVSMLSLQLFDGFLIITGVCALLGLLLFALLKKRQKVKLFGKIVSLCFIVVLVSTFLNEYMEENSKKRGTVIIQSVSDYKRDHGELPQSLDDLVPAYLPEIPTTSMRLIGSEYFYSKQGEEYLLGFSTTSLTGYVYDSREGAWQHRD